MVLRSSAAQYTRHHGEDDPEEAATGILEDTVPTTYPRESRSNSLVNANRYYNATVGTAYLGHGEEFPILSCRLILQIVPSVNWVSTLGKKRL